MLTAGQAEKSVLCLELAPQRLRLTLLDPQRRMVWLDEFTQPSLLNEPLLTDQLPPLFSQHPLLSYERFEAILVSVSSPAFTLIPSTLYRKEYATSYLSLMRGYPQPPTEQVFGYAHNEGFVGVFSLERTLTEFMGEQYPLQPVTYVHQNSALIQATRASDRQMLSPKNLFLFFEDEYVTLIFREGHALRYCNRFGVKNAQDLTYYVLYVLDELQTHPSDCQPVVYGEITPFAEGYIALRRFLPNLTIGAMPPGLNLSNDLIELPEHRFLSLQGLCLLAN